MVSFIQLIALTSLYMTWIPDNCGASPAEGESNDAEFYDYPGRPTNPQPSSGSRHRGADTTRKTTSHKKKDTTRHIPDGPGDSVNSLRHLKSTALTGASMELLKTVPTSAESYVRNSGEKGIDVDHIIELNAADNDRSNCWLIRFTKDSPNGVIITVYRHHKKCKLLHDGRMRKTRLATINRLIFWVDTDLEALTDDDVGRLEQMFRGMLAPRIRLTFDLMGDGTPHKLPIGAIRAPGDIDVDGGRGWHGTINLEHWFGKMGKSLTTLTLISVSSRCLIGCINHNKLASLTIVTYAEDEFHRSTRLLILFECQRFDIRLYDTNRRILARWRKLRDPKNGGEQMLVEGVMTTEFADNVARYLFVRKLEHFEYIEIVTEKLDDVFVEVVEILRPALEPFECYMVREIASTDDVNRRALSGSPKFMKDTNRISVDGTALNVKLSTKRFVNLPAGDRFTSIELEIKAAVRLQWPEVLLYGQWLMQCTIVELLHVLDNGAGIVPCAIELAALDKLNADGDKKSGLTDLDDIGLSIHEISWHQYLFDWYNLRRITFYPKTSNLVNDLEILAKDAKWNKLKCSPKEGYRSLKCCKFTRNV